MEGLDENVDEKPTQIEEKNAEETLKSSSKKEMSEQSNEIDTTINSINGIQHETDNLFDKRKDYNKSSNALIQEKDEMVEKSVSDSISTHSLPSVISVDNDDLTKKSIIKVNKIKEDENLENNSANAFKEEVIKSNGNGAIPKTIMSSEILSATSSNTSLIDSHSKSSSSSSPSLSTSLSGNLFKRTTIEAQKDKKPLPLNLSESFGKMQKNYQEKGSGSKIDRTDSLAVNHTSDTSISPASSTKVRSRLRAAKNAIIPYFRKLPSNSNINSENTNNATTDIVDEVDTEEGSKSLERPLHEGGRHHVSFEIPEKDNEKNKNSPTKNEIRTKQNSDYIERQESEEKNRVEKLQNLLNQSINEKHQLELQLNEMVRQQSSAYMNEVLLLKNQLDQERKARDATIQSIRKMEEEFENLLSAYSEQQQRQTSCSHYWPLISISLFFSLLFLLLKEILCVYQ